jgi:hypothetical protein
MSNARDKANIPALNFSSTGIDDNATSTAITINSSQNVDVAGTITSDGLKVSDSGGGILEIEGTTVTSGDTLGVIKAGSSVSLNVDDPASIKFKSNGSTGGNHRGAIEFFTNDTVNNARRLRVTPSGDIAFYEDTGTTAKMLWDASTERLGIGTTSPLRALSVVGASNAYANFDATSYESFTIGSDINGFLIYSEDAAAYRFNIDSSGRVGIGETSMDALLVIKGDSNGTTNPSIRLKDGSDTREAIVSNTSGDLVLATMNSSDNVVDSALTIYTSQMIFKVDGSEAMRIDSSGQVSIGSTSTSARLFCESNNDSVSTFRLNDTSSGSGGKNIAIFQRRGTNVGFVNVTDTSTSFVTSSDYRLKENVIEMTNATDRLKQLSPKRFNFIADADTTVDGFLAHEVSSVVPEAITGTHNEVDADGNPVYQGIDQSKLVPLLVKTIQELEARITALETQP